MVEVDLSVARPQSGGCPISESIPLPTKSTKIKAEEPERGAVLGAKTCHAVWEPVSGLPGDGIGQECK